MLLFFLLKQTATSLTQSNIIIIISYTNNESSCSISTTFHLKNQMMAVFFFVTLNFIQEEINLNFSISFEWTWVNTRVVQRINEWLTFTDPHFKHLRALGICYCCVRSITSKYHDSIFSGFLEMNGIEKIV